MLITLPALTLLVSAVAIAPDPGPTTCSAPAVNDATVADLRHAIPGGTFWLRQADFFPTFLSGSLELIDAQGNHIVAAGVRRTTAAVSFSAPLGVAVGDTFGLAENGVVASGVTLEIVAAPVTSPSSVLDDATPAVPLAIDCPEAFCSDSGAVPRVLTVDVTYEGGPVVVDVATTAPEEVFVDTTDRTVDSMLLPHVDTPTTVHMVAGQGRSQSMAVDLHVRFTDPDTRALVADQLLPLASIDEPVNGTPLPPCGNGGPFPRGGCQTVGCTVQCPPAVALLLVPLRLRALRRRRRQLPVQVSGSGSVKHDAIQS